MSLCSISLQIDYILLVHFSCINNLGYYRWTSFISCKIVIPCNSCREYFRTYVLVLCGRRISNNASMLSLSYQIHTNIALLQEIRYIL